MNREKIKSALKPVWSIPLIYKLWHLPTIYDLRAGFFNLCEWVDGYQHEKKLFKEKVGYDLDLRHPKSLNQKIVWKKITDRNPLLPMTADKYRVREYIKQVLGEKQANEILVPLFYVSPDPASIPFDSLPLEYVIKPNHAGGLAIFSTKEKPITDREETINTLRKWLKYRYSLFEHEWCYWSIKRQIIVEKLLRDTDGNLAQDYKFHVFHGKCRFIHTTAKKNAQRSGVRGLFTPDWHLLDVGWYYKEHAYVEPPKKLEEMITIAEKLAAPFDYVRVDLYNPSDKVYFGELTHYHGNGREPFYPRSFDFEAGEYWKLVPKYWEKTNYGT